jgi:holo-[acyl-carrier protein] synthase
MKAVSVGVDIVDVRRFRLATKAKGGNFIRKIFSQRERAYCQSFKDSGPRFAGTFAAKEAIQKASGLFNLSPVNIEVIRTRNGKPEVWIKGKPSKSILVSISHEKNIACAFAIYQK